MNTKAETRDNLLTEAISQSPDMKHAIIAIHDTLSAFHLADDRQDGRRSLKRRRAISPESTIGVSTITFGRLIKSETKRPHADTFDAISESLYLYPQAQRAFKTLLRSYKGHSSIHWADEIAALPTIDTLQEHAEVLSLLITNAEDARQLFRIMSNVDFPKVEGIFLLFKFALSGQIEFKSDSDRGEFLLHTAASMRELSFRQFNDTVTVSHHKRVVKILEDFSFPATERALFGINPVNMRTAVNGNSNSKEIQNLRQSVSQEHESVEDALREISNHTLEHHRQFGLETFKSRYYSPRLLVDVVMADSTSGIEEIRDRLEKCFDEFAEEFYTYPLLRGPYERVRTKVFDHLGIMEAHSPVIDSNAKPTIQAYSSAMDKWTDADQKSVMYNRTLQRDHADEAVLLLQEVSSFFSKINNPGLASRALLEAALLTE